ncbi:acetate--CoA ligase [Leucobacter sp. OLJS4]|uniref:acetate--CoA ligase n=1 Tax=unclassified Leucobacter TaxID=2621730 RepID=UPI000C17BF73|nr:MULTISPECIES: acetate--CoA ligase [unclassified Leucobacter]PII84810.1 acetate--CoA ligase [Leucobacter sp. OLCALW19]PII87763.1 acetate--CoA ligase [Leucobacter sp. OLTLW20]PII93851.1 acetate--CoA ligase [Leucobacter sp. OLAS13]PII98480.1 acetate--CoA ligase [Leucobacter sp. OLDS2]PIJ00461.1 acetate--CoA ligase [Leucobacter sp. OLCS4]
MTDQHGTIDSHPLDTETYPPSAEFAAQASLNDSSVYWRAAEDPENYWAEEARKLQWARPFTETLDWTNPPFAKWFADGTLNVAANCLDRHLAAGLGDRVAIHFEGEPGDTRTITYAELTHEVKRAANMLTSLGVKQGDRVAIYMPMIPEAIVSMLAVARLGAIHSVVFGGFSAESLRARIDDAQAELVITADGGNRKGRVSALKPTVDDALALQNGTELSVKRVLVVQRTGNDISMQEGRDLWWHEEITSYDGEHTAQAFPAENPLFILYTSGTTGRPKGILHTSGGYLTQASSTHRNVFDLKPETDVYWCTADIGWITGHSYVVYGPLANGATQVVYEGTPETPDWGRWWQIVEKYGVTVLYTAPTAIRACMKVGRQVPEQHDLSSIRVLGSVGEPINPEAWRWYRDVIGAGTAPIVDTWWQTETGAMMISPLPGLTTLKPGSAQVPLPGISIAVVDDEGNAVDRGQGGLLVVQRPWPSMVRTIWGDPDRFVETYWEKFGDQYFAGDGARLDEDGDIWLLGRVDDVMNVSGHRLSTTEIESALVGHHAVAEAAVVGASDETTGQAVVAFVILKSQQHLLTPEEAEQELRGHVARAIGAIARPRQVFVVNELPKTRSGKIMRRLLRDAAEGREIGDTTTLADTAVMQTISLRMRSEQGAK